MSAIVYPNATRLLSYFRNSSSLPGLVAADDGKSYVVKWAGGGEGVSAVATDWIGLLLARSLGIPVPAVVPIAVTTDLADQAADPELLELIRRSVGLNLGVEYLPKVRRYTPEHESAFDEDTKRRLYCYDALILNVDRTGKNPNILLSNGAPYCIDFASALEFRSVLDGRPLNDSPFLTLLRAHPFFTPSAGISREFPGPDDDALNALADSLPSEWVGTDDPRRSDLKRTFVRLFTDASSILGQRLPAIDSIIPESDEEHRRRTMANREAFEAAVAALEKRSGSPANDPD